MARALGSAGATVYVTGRSVRGGPPPPDGASGSVEETAEEVTRRGGRGIAAPCDHRNDAQASGRGGGKQGRACPACFGNLLSSLLPRQHGSVLCMQTLLGAALQALFAAPACLPSANAVLACRWPRCSAGCSRSRGGWIFS